MFDINQLMFSLALNLVNKKDNNKFFSHFLAFKVKSKTQQKHGGKFAVNTNLRLCD